MKRREFIGLVVGSAAWPFAAARAQQQGERTRLIGVYMASTADDLEIKARVAGFHEALEKLGWVEGRNMRLEHRWEGALSTDRAAAHTADLVRLGPDVILTQGSPVTEALAKATRDIPIVFVGASDPLSSGLVASLAHPGGNLTGFTNFEFSIGEKWLETLKEVSPALTRVLVIGAAGNSGNAGLLSAISEAAPSLNLQVVPALLSQGAEIEDAINAFVREPDGGLIVLPASLVLERRDHVVALASRYRLPAMYPLRPYINSGGLMSYDTDIVDLYRRAAAYVDRILRGEKPGDLSVQVPTKYELVINLKAAKALGLAVPLRLLARADEVIE
jgi:putative ABC transport system substrate-binding protein